MIKALNTALREHPFHTVRAGELNRWQLSGAYATIVSGDYIRRGSEAERPLRDDLRDAKDFYAEKAKAAAETVGDVINRAADAFRDDFATLVSAYLALNYPIGGLVIIMTSQQAPSST